MRIADWSFANVGVKLVDRERVSRAEDTVRTPLKNEVLRFALPRAAVLPDAKFDDTNAQATDDEGKKTGDDVAEECRPIIALHCCHARYENKRL